VVPAVFVPNEHPEKMAEYVLTYAHPTFSEKPGIIYEVENLRMSHSDDEAAVRWTRFDVPGAYNLIRDGEEYRALPLTLRRAASPADVLIWEIPV
jgi:hypothetical protein